MNRIIRIAATGLFLVFTSQLCQSAAPAKGRKDQRAETFRRVESGPHHSVFESRISDQAGPSLVERPRSRYVELASGLNRYDDKQRQWVPAKAVFEKTRRGGVVARQTQHQLILPADLAKEPIDMLCPDGTRLISAPLGLAFLDLRTGESVLIAELKPCEATLATASAVVYQDCFAGIRADLVYDLQLGSLEQDLVLREHLPPPEQFGMDPDHVRVQVLTEFFEAPEPRRDRRMVKEASKVDRSLRRVAPDLTDEELSFGESMRMPRGRAFSVGEDGDGPGGGVPMGKSFEQLEGRKFLVESTEYEDLVARLRHLPFPRRADVEKSYRSARIEPGAQLIRLPDRIERAPEWVRLGFAERMAEEQWAAIFEQDLPERSAREYLAMSGEGLVLDYTLESTQTDFVFEAGTTYYVPDRIFLSGTTVLEGGAVIKYPPTSSALAGVAVNGPLVCKTSAYRPAIFTARDDNTVGVQLPETTGVVSGHYGYFGLGFYFSNGPVVVEHVTFRFTTYGLLFLGESEHTVRHSRIVHSQIGVIGYTGRYAVKLRNVLVDGAGAGLYAFHAYGNPQGIDAEHVTVHDYPSLCLSSDFVALKNSLVVKVGNAGSYTSVGTEWLQSDTGVFAQAGAGAHYLPANSPYRDGGTLGVEAGLLDEIRSTTTSVPEVLPSDLAVDTVLGPRAIRDTDTPDLGYHYPTLDYLVRDVSVEGAHLQLAGGVAIGFHGETGFLLGDAARLSSVGSPTQPNRLVCHTAVQEQFDLLGAPVGSTLSMIRTEPPFNLIPEVDLRFSEISAMAGSGSRSAQVFYSTFESARLKLSDCQVLNVGVHVFGSGAPTTTVELANNVMEHGWFEFWQRHSGSHAVDLDLHNNLFRGGLLLMVYRDPTGEWSLRDNLVEGMDVIGIEYDSRYAIPATHNAFYNTFGFGENQYRPTACDYQPGPLGDYYYPTSGTGLASLIDAGDRPAGSAGLYHHTTCVALGAEGDSPVDVGFHYVGMTTDGTRPADTDADELPDYREDLNGNGAYDSLAGETDWLRPDGYVGEPPKLIVFTVLEPTP